MFFNFSVYLSLYLSASLYYVYLSIHLSSLPVDLSTVPNQRPICMSIYLLLLLSTCISISLELRISISYLSICLAVYRCLFLSISSCVFLNIYTFICKFRSICPASVWKSIYLLSICLCLFPIWLSVSINLPVHLYIHICLWVYMFICLSAYQSAYISVYLSACLGNMFICIAASPHIRLSIRVSI